VNTFRFPRCLRIRSSHDYERIYQLRQRAGDSQLLVFAAPNELDVTRMGMSVSRRHGGAVKRMRLKRLLREAFRLTRHDLPSGLDLIVIPRQNSCAGLDDYKRSLGRLVRKLARRMPER